MWTELSDTAIMEKLGARMKARRISIGLKQQELAKESGVGISTITKIEGGQSVAFSLLISVIRTLGLLENLDQLIPALQGPYLSVRKAAMQSVLRFAELGLVYQRMAKSVLKSVNLELF